MNSGKTSAQLKSMSKSQLLGNYSTAIGAILLLQIITCTIMFIASGLIDFNSLSGSIIYYAICFIVELLTGIFSVGLVKLFLNLACNQPVSLKDLFYGFSEHPDKAIMIKLIMTILETICMIPCIVSGFMYEQTKSVMWILAISITFIIGCTLVILMQIMFSQVFYLLLDFPQFDATQLLKLSSRIMKGHKFQYFYLMVSFIGIYLLGIVSLFVGFLWIAPYRYMTFTYYYLDLITSTDTSLLY